MTSIFQISNVIQDNMPFADINLSNKDVDIKAPVAYSILHIVQVK